jgi:hypothetical protein
MHAPPPDALQLAEALKDSNPAYLKLIPHETCLRAARARNIPWKQLETRFQTECGEKTSYSTLRRFLGDTDRLRAAWAEAMTDPAPSPGRALPREDPPNPADREASQSRLAALEAELAALRAVGFEREEQLVAQQHEIAELLQRNLAMEAERDALATQTKTFDDGWPPPPGAKRRGCALGLLAGLLLAALALAAWLIFTETPLRGLAAFAEASALVPALPGRDWLAALRPHRTFLYVAAAVIAAGLLCGLGPLRACALGLLVWLTYSAMIHRLYGAFWILLFLTVRVAGTLLYSRRDFP